ncbi:MAG: hypothetical protein PHQ27_07580 [Victivallales bacterium]|nr:hypothetical protein [Victivallales bacterium]
MDFEICDVEYTVVLADDFSVAEITPELIFTATRDQTLVASVNIDHLEMIPSFRVAARAGNNRVMIRSFRIFNPRIRQPEDPEGVKIYALELQLASSVDCFKSHSKELTITPSGAGPT